MKRGGEIEGNDEIPFLDRELLDRRNILRAGVVDEDVHPAKGGGGFAHHRLDFCRLGKVMAGIDRPRIAQGFERQPLPLDGLRVAKAVDHEVCALFGKRLRIGQADTRG